MEKQIYEVKDRSSIEAIQFNGYDSFLEIKKWIQSIYPNINVHIAQNDEIMHFDDDGQQYIRLGDYILYKKNKFVAWRQRAFEIKYKII